jgi:hypothetical protein
MRQKNMFWHQVGQVWAHCSPVRPIKHQLKKNKRRREYRKELMQISYKNTPAIFIYPFVVWSLDIATWK